MGSSRKIRGDVIGIHAKIDIVLEPGPGTHGLIGSGIESDRSIGIDDKFSGLVIGLVVSPGNKRRKTRKDDYGQGIQGTGA
jgi:hypothetical protein